MTGTRVPPARSSDEHGKRFATPPGRIAFEVALAGGPSEEVMTEQQIDTDGAAATEVPEVTDDVGMASSEPLQESDGTENVQRDQKQGGRLGNAMRKPSVGAGVAGGIVLGAAWMFGVLEAAVAAGAAYGAYHLLRKRSSDEGRQT
jgi:hypothetical protein